MTDIFDKAIVFTDIHFGRSANSVIANKDNLDFFDWAIDEGKTWGASSWVTISTTGTVSTSQPSTPD